jgi:hypothetical protein
MKQSNVNINQLLNLSQPMKSLSINSTSSDPYGLKIVDFLSPFIGGANLNNFKTVLNALEDALYANKDVRYGPKPEPESIVHVRSIIGAYVKENRPIPVLMPWGSIKGKFGERLDIAEISAINQLTSLIKRVKIMYPPGLQIVIRVEDTSGYQLFERDARREDLNLWIPEYINDFKSLIQMLPDTDQITVLFESEMRGAPNFEANTITLIPVFLEYLKDSDDLLKNGGKEDMLSKLNSWLILNQKLGWQGIVSSQQRNYYYQTYRKLYEGMDEGEVQVRLATYLAQAITRRNLDMSGKQSEWNHNFIQLTFVSPIPGLPEGYDKNYVYYRTIPENCCRTHMSPWRSKGYLRITDNGLCPKLAVWSEQKHYHEHMLVVSDGEKSIEIQADYILE